MCVGGGGLSEVKEDVLNTRNSNDVCMDFIDLTFSLIYICVICLLSQAYAVSKKAGHQTSAESWGTGRAVR